MNLRNEVYHEPEPFSILIPEKQLEFNSKFDELLYDDLPILLPQDDDVDGWVCVRLLTEIIRYLNPNKTIEVYIPDTKTHGITEHFMTFVEQYNTQAHIIITDSSSEQGALLSRLSLTHKVLLIDHHLTNIKEDLDLICHYHANCRYESNRHFHGLSAGYYVYLHLLNYLLSKNFKDPVRLGQWFTLAMLALVADVCDMTTPYNKSALHYYMECPYSHEILQYFSNKFTRNSLYFLAFQVAPKLNMLFRLRYINYLRRLLSNNNLQETVEHICAIYENYKVSIDQSMQFLTIRKCANKFVYADTTNIPEIFSMFKGKMENFTGWYANRLSQLYAKPAVVISKTASGEYKGSVRDSHREDIYSICDAIPYINGGGHPSAYGFTINLEDFGQFKADFYYGYPDNLQKPPSTLPIESLVTLQEINRTGELIRFARYNDYTLNDKIGFSYVVKYSDVIDYYNNRCIINNDDFKIICFETSLQPGDTINLMPDNTKSGMQLVAEITKRAKED